MRALKPLLCFLAMTHVARAAGVIFITRVIDPVSPPPPVETMKPLKVKSTTVRTKIEKGVANTHVDQVFSNSSSWQLEGEYMFFLPENASVDEFALYINGERVQGELLEREKAKGIYEGIVRRMQDPALLEYMGKNVFKARIFPIPANGERRIELKYKEVVPRDFDMSHYVYPVRTPRSLQGAVGSLDVEVTIDSEQPIKNVYSPTHGIKTESTDPKKSVVRFQGTDVATDQDFSLYFSSTDQDLGINLVSYRPDDDDGYFLLLLAPPAQREQMQAIPKDIVFVLDTSGSMAGERIEQARQALKTCVSALDSKDRFSLITFATESRQYSDKLLDASEDNLKKATKFIQGIKAMGGTNINEGLSVAFKLQGEDRSRPFIVVFITDGEPTVGVTDPKEILANAKAANKSDARIFSIGVGEELNVHLVDEIARENRGYSEYIKPKENIEIKVSQFYQRISSPVLTDISVEFGKISTSDVYPKKLGDLFHGQQLTMVGRYSTHGATAITLKGKRGSQAIEYKYDAKFAETEQSAEFLPSIWANRKVGYLLDEIRLHGESAELKDEVIRLAKQYAIVTPYTAYLVVEDQPMAAQPMRGPPVETRRSSMRMDPRPVPVMPGAPTIQTVEDGFVKGDRDLEAAPDPTSGGRAGGALKDEAEARSNLAPAEEAHASKPSVFLQREQGAADKVLNITSGSRAVEASEELKKMKEAGADGKVIAGADSRSSKRTVGSRTFRQEGGAWVDTGVKPADPVVTIKYGSAAYFQLLSTHTELARFASLGKALKVAFKGKTLIISETEGQTELTEDQAKALFSK